MNDTRYVTVATHHSAQAFVYHWDIRMGELERQKLAALRGGSRGMETVRDHLLPVCECIMTVSRSTCKGLLGGKSWGGGLTN